MQPTKTIRLIAMSDTHSQHHKFNIADLPKGDIFIHSGDFTKYSRKSQLDSFRTFLSQLPYKHKIIIAGNHDFALDRMNYQNLQPHKHPNQPLNTQQQILKLKTVCTYLDHQMIEIQGIKIFGSPYQPEFYDWGFMYAPEQGEKIWSTLPKGIDVLITHGPPYGILDKTCRKQNVGCKGLKKFVQLLRPQVHIFGHIHQSYGHQQRNGINYYNASNVNLMYHLVNPITIIDIPVIPKQ